MLYLITGANGSGKTLLTLKHVKELADKEARPVCYNGRFDLNPDGPLANWRKVDIKDWQSEPDGTIFFVDECHNDFPVRPNSEKPPEYVRMLAEHRKRGFDFFLITQHPQNLDVFIRRLIGNPGWHRHLKRVAGAQIVSQLQWDSVNPNCEKPGAGTSGQVRTVPYPKEVYAWYHSAQLHTGKVKIPRAVYVLVACAILVPTLGYFAFRTVTKNVMGRAEAIKPVAAAPGAPGAPAAGVPGGRADSRAQPMTPAEYAVHRAPRFQGLAYTAPAYDSVTTPTVAPYPAACVEGVRPGTSARICNCWSQQGTVLPVPADICSQIVRNGFFVDWQLPQSIERPVSAPGAAAAAGDGGLVVADAVAVSQAHQARDVLQDQVQSVARAPAPAPAPPPAAGPAPAAAGGRGFRR